ETRARHDAVGKREQKQQCKIGGGAGGGGAGRRTVYPPRDIHIADEADCIQVGREEYGIACDAVEEDDEALQHDWTPGGYAKGRPTRLAAWPVSNKNEVELALAPSGDAAGRSPKQDRRRVGACAIRRCCWPAPK